MYIDKLIKAKNIGTTKFAIEKFKNAESQLEGNELKYSLDKMNAKTRNFADYSKTAPFKNDSFEELLRIQNIRNPNPMIIVEDGKPIGEDPRLLDQNMMTNTGWNVDLARTFGELDKEMSWTQSKIK